MTAFAGYNAKLRLRAYEIQMRSHGFYPCVECRELTDHRASDDTFCCESCCEQGDKERESENRYSDNRRF